MNVRRRRSGGLWSRIHFNSGIRFFAYPGLLGGWGQSSGSPLEQRGLMSLLQGAAVAAWHCRLKRLISNPEPRIRLGLTFTWNVGIETLPSWLNTYKVDWTLHLLMHVNEVPILYCRCLFKTARCSSRLMNKYISYYVNACVNCVKLWIGVHSVRDLAE